MRRAGRVWSTYAVLRLLPPLAVGCAIWFLEPPDTLTPTAMHMLAVFVAVILSFLTAPYPMSVTVRFGALRRRERTRPPVVGH